MSLLGFKALTDRSTLDLLLLDYLGRSTGLSREFTNLASQRLGLFIFKENYKARWQFELAYQVMDRLIQAGTERL